ncbi:MAG TPA: serine/threonine-protein kinase [Gemmatimonadales bacterium]|nr:serine/threonine-protein kinase [Gemmatimonadales bacterium]
MSLRRCPRCNQSYQAPARYCVHDGSLLVEEAGERSVAGGRTPLPRVSDFAGPEPAADAAVQGPSPAANPLTTLSGQILDGRYRVGARLGEGGMSYVYRAEEIETGRIVALKILLPRLSRDPASVERLRREATIAMRLDHPNVCPILRLGETPDRLMYLVMPFLEGEPLSEHEARRGPISTAEGVPLLIQMCHGLQHAHELQIIHRDLKPENVMLVPVPGTDSGAQQEFTAVVMDFGLAKERRAGPELAKLTATGIVLGTPEFMSPEQIRGKPLDGRSDVYALGVLAFELFSGQLPFPGKSAQETMIARLRGQPIKLRQVKPDVPARVEAVISQALAMDPTQRFGSMREMAHALEAAHSPGLLGRIFGR